MRLRMLALAPLILVAIVAFVALGGYVVMALWNWLLPPLFGWHAVTFWQALGLLVLCRLLFGGMGMARGGRPRWRNGAWARWRDMPPEERERVREKIREKFGYGEPPHGSERV